MTGGFGGNYVAARRASSTALIGVYSSQAVVNTAAVPFVAKAIPGYTLLNLMVRRPITERIDLQANVNNIANKRPPTDTTNGNWPYYDVTLYNALGRSVYLEVGYDFGK